MATITPTFAKIRGTAGGIDAVVTTWTGLVNSGDLGAGLQRTDISDRSISMTGTFGAGTVVFEGSNDSVDGVGGTWFTLSSPSGAALSFTAPGLLQVTEATAWVRPHCTVTVTSVNAILTARRSLR